MRFFQQPAGFEDSVLSGWIVEEQHEAYGLTIALRDLFGGGLSESTRNKMSLCQQLAAFIRGKITSIIQLADTHVIQPFKACTTEQHAQLRKELMRLAEVEGTRAVFRCGTYEMMRTLLEVVDKMKESFESNQRMLKAMYQLGYLSLRPNFETKKLEKTEGKAWCKDFKFGTHRMPKSWCEKRYEHIVDGVPQPFTLEVNDTNMPEDVEQTYWVQPGEKRDLAVWQQMLKDKSVSEEMLRDWRAEPWFELAVESFEGVEGLDELGELMKTPQQLRREHGLDVGLTTQRKNKEALRGKARTRQLAKIARAPLRAEALKKMRDM